MTGRRRTWAVAALLAVAWAVTAVAALAGSGATTSAMNHHAAIRDARQLLSRLQLPPGATASSAEPSGDHGTLHHAFGSPGTKFVDEHAWWTTTDSPDEVLSYLKAHPAAGGTQDQAGSAEQCKPGTAPPEDCHTTAQYLGSSFPAVAGKLGIRWLLVTVAPLSDGSTGVRADAEVQWIIIRSRSEVVPAGVQMVQVTKGFAGQPPSVSRNVSSAAHIHKIIELLNHLPVVQPENTHCPAIRAAPTVTLTFRNRSGGPALAEASVRANVGNSDSECDAMSFSIGGKRRDDLANGHDFLLAVGRVLHVRLAERPS